MPPHPFQYLQTRFITTLNPLRSIRTRIPLPRTRYKFLRRLRIYLVCDRVVDWKALAEKGFKSRDSGVKTAMAPKPGYYAVSAGYQPGVYMTWAECEAQVKGFPGAKYKKFATKSEAEHFAGVSVPSSSTALTPAQASSSFASPSTRLAQPPLNTFSTSASANEFIRDAQSRGYTVEDGYLVVYTDGSSLGNGKMGSRGGCGVWWGGRGDAEARNLAEALPGTLQTNNRAELLAIIRALETTPYPLLPIEIRTDSQYAISSLTLYLPKWLSNGFRSSSGGEVKNVDMIVHLLALLNKRGGLKGGGVRFKHVRGHVGELGNEEADRLANIGSTLPLLPDRTDWLTLQDAKREDQALQRNRGPSRHKEELIDLEFAIDPAWILSEQELERELYSD